MIKLKNLPKIFIVATLVVSLVFLLMPQITNAAALDTLSDVMTRLKNSSSGTVYSNHTVTFSLGSSTSFDATETILVDFDDDFGITGFATTDVEDYDIKVNSTEESIVANGGCAANDAIEITTVSGANKSFTFTACGSYTTEGNDATIEIQIGTNATTGGNGNTQLSNPSASQTALVDITAAGDTGKIAVVIVDDDQVQLTGTVDPSITFSLSANSSAFGTLPVGSIDTSSPNITLTVGTNAENGYTISVQDQGNSTNPGFYNSSATYLIGSANATFDDTDTLVGGVEGYGIQASSAGATIAARYDQSGDTVGGFEITATTLASYGTTMTANHTITIVHKAAIATFTAAGSYNDIITYIATGNF